MNSIICTLYEKKYHYGLAGFVNSLVHYGFEGKVYAGYKQNEGLPEWSIISNKSGLSIMIVTEKIELIFIPEDTNYHFTNYKPAFLLKIMEFEKDAINFFYFDPDIVITQKWILFEEWVKYGVGFCQDVNFYMPSNHISKKMWMDFASVLNFKEINKIDGYCNGGFVGLKRQHSQILENWKYLLDKSIELGYTKINTSWYEPDDFSKVFGKTEDQDIMNLAMMVTDVPLSLAGPDAMGFQNGRRFMFHSIGSPKAWDISWRNVFKRKKISLANIEFFKFINHPINIKYIYGVKLKLIILLNKFK